MKPFHKAHSSAIFNLTITGVFLALSLIFFYYHIKNSLLDQLLAA